MADSFGPRTYLIGQILNGIAANVGMGIVALTEDEAKAIIKVADSIQDTMAWPNGKPERLEM